MKSTYKELAQAVRGMIGQDNAAQKIAAFLVAERRTGEADRIMREVERLQIEEDNIVEVTTTSARPLSVEVKAQISQLFAGQEVKIMEKQDADLVGGVHIKTLDTQLDLSVSGQLKGLRNSLKG